MVPAVNNDLFNKLQPVHLVYVTEYVLCET